MTYVEKICGLRKEFTVIENFGLKPNFKYLGEVYDMDPRTVKKYYEGYNGKATTRNKNSALDEFDEIIKEKLSIPGVKISALYFYLKEEKGYKGSYSNITYYIRKNHKDWRKKSGNAKIRFDTDIGEQLQFDWVEDITLTNKYGVEYNFNIFSAELSYSRMHFFYFSYHKTREDVIKCLIESIKYFGGIPEGFLTDNMSSIVNTNKKEFIPEFKTFCKDIGVIASKCKVRHPHTKGKVEVRNKFIKWLIPYNNEFEDDNKIIEVIKKINIEVNTKINDTTGMKPILLYQKEKEYLKPMPSNQILEHYMNLSTSVTVRNTSLIYYKGSEYSVPPKYINKTLKIKDIDNKLYIYDNTDLIATHEITNKKINYKEEHYIIGLKANMPDKSDEYIDALAQRNLDIMDKIAQQAVNKGE